MAISLNSTLRSTRATAIITFASASAKLRIYTAAYGALLCECVCNAAQFGTESGGVVTLSAISAGTATGAGTAAIARILKSDGTTMVIEGLTVGVGGGFNVNITNTTIAVNDTVTVTSATISEGNP